MCPRFNLVLEETPREFLYQERKTSLGEGCLSKQTDQTELVRDREGGQKRRALYPRLLNPCRLCYFANLFPRSRHVPAPSTVSRTKTLLWLCLSAPSLPLSFTLLPGPLPPSTTLFTCASVLMHSVAYHTLPPFLSPIFTEGMSEHSMCDQGGGSICLWPVQLTIDSSTWRRNICLYSTGDCCCL